jgi:hypothetical protein
MAIKAKANYDACDEAAAVTTSDTNDLRVSIAGIPDQGAFIYVGVSGDVKVDLARSGTAVVYKNWPAGAVLPFLVRRVYTTGTSATDLVANW